MGSCCLARGLSSVLCDDLNGWDGGGMRERSKREGANVYIWLIHFIVQQKPTQHCKAITPQQKKKKKDNVSLAKLTKVNYDKQC